MKTFITKYPVAAFIILTFGISFLIGFPLKLFILNQLFRGQELGLNYYSKIFIVFGPALAAIIVTAVTSGKAGITALIGQLKPNPKHLIWWLALPVAGTLLTVLAFIPQGVTAPEMINLIGKNWGFFLAHLVLTTLMIGIGEELGWRGWLLPKLSETRTLTSATLIVFIIWALWHFPLLLSGYKVAIPFVIINLSMSVIFTWIWQRVNGNIFVLAIAHASVDFPEAFFESRVIATGHNWNDILNMWAILSTIYAVPAIIIFFVLRAHQSPKGEAF
ncbi:CPBP family intramembrane glutamic endopeptidase [Mucilaginibacter sp. SG564]|uniref:CPBP family intramembrane glutamic endopeptidase n=2 Tax=unclassified Mucilaginibacter TaxID=2617802 RepID=UPI001553EF9A|nr:type II CAAX endopeptidase family protein [Mucilaginibacter sp. SG564]NOW96201.1 membrane protease YdiL (CAAX protease family) [Mucilaginibacter sp. SG564]